VTGLHEIMAELHSYGIEANSETAQEIIKRLEGVGNFIPESEVARREYAYLLLKEYEEYIESHTNNKGK
jgi:hypothetical protein